MYHSNIQQSHSYRATTRCRVESSRIESNPRESSSFRAILFHDTLLAQRFYTRDSRGGEVTTTRQFVIRFWRTLRISRLATRTLSQMRNVETNVVSHFNSFNSSTFNLKKSSLKFELKFKAITMVFLNRNHVKPAPRAVEREREKTAREEKKGTAVEIWFMVYGLRNFPFLVGPTLLR